MKRIVVIGLVTVVMLATSLPARAQGFMGFPFGVQSFNPNAGIFGQYFGGLGQCGPQIWTPTFYVGYVTHRNGVNFHSDYYQEAYFEDISIPLQGLWLGASLNLLVGDVCGLMLRGGALVPCNLRADDSTTTPDRLILGYQPRLDSQWSIVDALATYRLYHSFHLIGGFRWDHFLTKLEYRDTNADGDTNFKINAFLPVVGFQTQQGNAGTFASAGIIGFPLVPGNFRYEWSSPVNADNYHELSSQFWNQGYFLECFLRFNQRLYGTADLGVFATFNVLHAVTGRGSYDWNEPPDVGTNGLEYVFHRQSWTFGGSLSVDFFTL